ncbi:uncharacterized protein LOC127833536 [Dreissena polymorpha]|uniref:ADP-ribosyl cyclase/cyclic ADP-ribose hydrolase n=1 Tax=Dreissena polymorpha TaxID=45954 RepID=A0A9D4JIA9_DREPO|nr:uncharacterized protein LOC127833536 [Dreissena polymorpha]KAH3809763.1 hypothetical protein DPMN_138141 [Dreissena polymorpha]
MGNASGRRCIDCGVHASYPSLCSACSKCCQPSENSWTRKDRTRNNLLAECNKTNIIVEASLDSYMTEQIVLVKPDKDVQAINEVPDDPDSIHTLEFLDGMNEKNDDWSTLLAHLLSITKKDDRVIYILMEKNVDAKFEMFIETHHINDVLEMNTFPNKEADSVPIKLQTIWSTVKRFLMLFWICCDTNVNFCQYTLSSTMFYFLMNNLKSLALKSYHEHEVCLFTVKAALGIIHNITRHLPNSKILLRSENAVSTVHPYLKSKIAMVRIKSLMILSFILSEHENVMINTEDENFVFIFEVLADALKNNDHKTAKFGMSAIEILKGLNQLAVNDENKLRMVSNGVLELFEVLLLRGFLEEVKVTIVTLWSLSFHHYNKSKMKKCPHIVKKLQELKCHPDTEISHAARGTVWELMNMKVSSTTLRWSSNTSSENDPWKPHIMISYQWDSQNIMLRVKDRLKQAGYKVWMDVEHMTGSTLEAMALAVEKAAVVLLCMSQKYKESPNCRTEAEYVYRLRKDFIPLRVQEGYVADGWLGILAGTRLYFDFYSEPMVDVQIPRLVRELNGRGLINPTMKDLPDSAITSSPRRPEQLTATPIPTRIHRELDSDLLRLPTVMSHLSPWSETEVKQWLLSVGLDEYIESFSGMTGTLLKELRTIQSTAPESFIAILKNDYRLPILALLTFSRSLRSLE